MNTNRQRKIVYKDYGIADVLPDGTIELNKHLDDYPELKKALIQHELKHSSTPGFTRKDFYHDLTTMDQIKTWHLIKFMSRHPGSLVGLLPITYSFKKNRLSYDINSLIIWGCLTLIVVAAMIIGFKA